MSLSYRTLTHRTPDGRNLRVTHGDLSDGPIQLGTNLGQFGAAAYRVLVALDVIVKRLVRKPSRRE